jgi:hypothetical protein
VDDLVLLVSDARSFVDAQRGDITPELVASALRLSASVTVHPVLAGQVLDRARYAATFGSSEFYARATVKRTAALARCILETFGGMS